MNKDTCDRTNAGRNADSRSSEDIKRDIDRQLYEMDQTATQLQGRLSLHGLIDEVKDVFTTSGRRAPGRLMEAARDNPVPAALIGLGVVWMVADRLSGKGRHEHYEVGRGRDSDWLSPGAEYFPGRAGESGGEYGPGRSEGGAHVGRRVRDMGSRVGEMGSEMKDRAGGMIENMKDRVGSVKDRISGVGHSISNLGHTARDKASQVGDRVSHMGAAARDKLHHYGDTVQRQASAAKDKTVDMYEEQPLAFGAAALAVGVVGGLLVPSSRKEDELLGPMSDKVKDRAKDLGQTAYEQGKQAAQELGTRIKEEVSGDQPIAEKIRDVAHRVVDTTKQSVRESVQQLSKGQTGPGSQIGERSGDRGGEFGDAGGAPTMGAQGKDYCDLPGESGRNEWGGGSARGMPPIGDENVD